MPAVDGATDEGSVIDQSSPPNAGKHLADVETRPVADGQGLHDGQQEKNSVKWPCLKCLAVYRSWTSLMRIIASLLMLNNFCGFACQSVIAPFFPLVAQERGVSTHVVGLIFGCYAFAAFLFAPVWGKLVPILGPRVTLVIGGSVCGIASVVFGLLYFIHDTVAFTAGSFMVRITEAIGYAAFNTASFTVAARMFPDSLSTVMALLEIAVGAGLAAGPGIGSALYSIGGYITPFAFLGVLMVTCSVPLWLQIPSKEDLRREEDVVNSGTPYWKMLTSVSPALACFSVLADGIGFSFLLPILAMRVGELGVPVANAGYIFMAHFGMYALSGLFVGPLSDAFPRLRFLFCGLGLAVMGLGYLVIGPSPIFGSTISNSLPVVIAGLFVIGLGSSFALVPSFPLLLTTAVRVGLPDNMTTLALMGGLWNALYSLGDTFGPMMGASFTESFGFPTATTIVFGILLFLGLCNCINFIVEQQKPLPAEVDKREVS